MGPAYAGRARKRGGPKLSWKKLIRSAGPGIIAGASDDDPSGIGTYSQVGAQFGFGMLWTMLFTLPLMSAVQEVSALIGRTTGHGLAANVRRYQSRWLVYPLVLSLVVANFINIGADLGAMGASMRLVVGGPAILWVILFAAASLVAELFIPYHKYARVLKWLTLSLLAYVGTVLIVHLDWRSAGVATVMPHIGLDKDTLTALVAILGTTISPYLFFWQASMEVEEIDDHADRTALKRAPRQAKAAEQRIKADTYAGMFASNLVAWFIIAATAATLFAAGVHNIDTADKAAQALAPVAGRFATILFALGIVGTGLLAVPVLAGSAAFGVGEAFKWRSSLEEKPKNAPKFYGVIAIGAVIGVALNLLSINPITALYWTAVINGFVAVPLLVVIMRMSGSHRVMGKTRPGRIVRALGWITTIVMTLAAAGMIWTTFR